MSSWLNGDWTEDVQRKLAKQMKGFIKPAIIREGIRVFLAGCVMNGEWKSGRIYSAISKDTNNPSQTVIQLDFLPFSRCSCEASGSCRHMAAVIFDAMQSQSLPVKEFWKKQGMLELGESESVDSVHQNNTTAARSAAITPISTASGAASGSSGPTVSLTALTPEDDFKIWHRKFKERMPTYKYQDKYYVQWIEQNLLRQADMWQDQQLRTLYRAHALLYALSLVDQSHNSGFHATIRVDSRQMLSELTDKLVDELQAIGGQNLRERQETATYLDGLLFIIHRYAFVQDSVLIDWITLYRVLVNNLSLSHEQLLSEQERISGRIAEQRGGNLQQRLVAAMAHLLLVEKGDSWAVAYLHEQDQGQLTGAIYFDYAAAYYQLEKWNELQLWMDWLKLQLPQGGQQLLAGYLEIWDALTKKRKSTEQSVLERKQLLAELLPSSFELYTEHLISIGEYRNWVDVHMAYGRDPYRSKGYDKLKKTSPGALLPMLHYEVEYLIQLKKRDDYRHAVIRMKEIRQAYMQESKDYLWQTYRGQIMNRFPRLKMLHDEMRKGGIID